MALNKRAYTDEETLITAQNLNDIQDAIIELEDGLFAIEAARSGEAITVTDAAQRGFKSLRICGKTTQGGTPTPDAPVELVSSSDGESISIHVSGKNLFTGWTVGGLQSDTGATNDTATHRRTDFIPISVPGQKHSISNTPDTLYNYSAFYDAEKNFISRTPATPTKNRRIEPPMNAKYFILTIYENAQLTGEISEADAMANMTMIEVGDTATGYERPQQIQTATIFPINGLCGFPVTSGGNYTDENGQQWVCDEIDLKRGVYVQRIGKVTLNGEEKWLGYLVSEVNQFHVVLPSVHKVNEKGAMCKYYRPIVLSERNLAYGTIYTYNNGVAINTQECATVDEWKALLANRPITVLYVLAEPVETPLDEEAISAYGALHAYREHATISNSGHAHMELEYGVDAKKYIDGIMKGAAGWIADVPLLASAWKGNNSPYSQVVAIEGVTANSQVDLTPDVAQLAIFHEKDLAFVTENVGGVVTVYAVGQKPTNDYTIQATIKEVYA